MLGPVNVAGIPYRTIWPEPDGAAVGIDRTASPHRLAATAGARGPAFARRTIFPDTRTAAPSPVGIAPARRVTAPATRRGLRPATGGAPRGRFSALASPVPNTRSQDLSP